MLLFFLRLFKHKKNNSIDTKRYLIIEYVYDVQAFDFSFLIFKQLT
jgi:hypothetical protein